MIDWTKKPLGKMSDRALAKKPRVPHTAVRQARLRLGIKPAHKAPRHKTWSKRLPGKIPDAELARRVGVSRQTVYLARVKRGIEKCD